MDIDVQNFKPSYDYSGFVGDEMYSNFLPFIAAGIGGLIKGKSDSKKGDAAANAALEQAKIKKVAIDKEYEDALEAKRVEKEKVDKDLLEAQNAAKIKSEADKVQSDKDSAAQSIVTKARNKKLLIGGGILAAIIAAYVIFKK